MVVNIALGERTGLDPSDDPDFGDGPGLAGTPTLPKRKFGSTIAVSTSSRIACFRSALRRCHIEVESVWLPRLRTASPRLSQESQATIGCLLATFCHLGTLSVTRS